MKSFAAIALSLILTFGVVSSVFGQIMPFRTYSIEQGLSESVVHSLLQDDKGYIWLGTGFGLNRFDGVEFKKWYEEDGLPNNRVNALEQSKDGRLWIGTDRGIAYMEADSIHTEPEFELLRESVVLSIYEDYEGSVWIATEGSGLWRYDGPQQFMNVSQEYGFRDLMARSVTGTGEGKIWIGTASGLFGYDGETFKKYRSRDGVSEVPVNELKVDPDGKLWMATEAGLITYLNGESEIYHTDAGLNDCRIHSLSLSGDGVWIGTERGASFFNGISFENYSSENGLNAITVYDTLVDREGNVWLATLGGGANMFLGELFKNYNVDTGLSNNMVVGFEEDTSGNIWVATYGGGILRYNGEEFIQYREEDGLVDDKTYVIKEDSDGRIWIGTRSGISIYEDGNFETLESPGTPFNMVRDIFEDEESGDIWIATYNSGVFRYDGESAEQFDTRSGLLNNTVMKIRKDSSGQMIFATYGGIAMLKDGSFNHLTVADGLPNNGVIHIHIDHEGTLWASTFSGIASYDGEDLNAVTTSAQSNTISYFTIQDAENGYWVGTNRGIYQFDPEQFFSAETRVERIKSFKLFDKNQGLVANELNAGGGLLATDGTLWLGSVEGISHFFPDRITTNQKPPGIEFEEIMMSGELQKQLSGTEFGNEQNFLQISFTGLSFESPEQILYEYRLAGLEDEWQTTRDRTVRYTSLPPNEYRFRIRAYNADGLQSSEEAVFAFTIHPPIWQQWWFFALLTAAVFGLIFFYYRHFKARKQIDIERMRVQIASDLHDDVGSSLTELALQTDFLMAGDISDELRDTLQQLGSQSRKIVSSLDDIVWSIDSRNDTAGDVTDRMQDYINQVFRAGGPKVNYHFDNLKMDDRLPVHIKENIYLIFKESINNIAKHSNADQVDVMFAYDGKSYRLKVKDNGTASNGTRKSGQGLRNIELRSNRIGGEVEIRNSDGFTVHVVGTV